MILQHDRSAYVASVATAFPDHRVDARRASDVLRDLFRDEDPEAVDSLVRRSGVAQRFLVDPPEDVLARSRFTDRNRRFGEAAVDLAVAAAERALGRAGVAAREVDAVVDVSCTGIAIPAVDVFVAQRLGLRPDVRRIPITEAGCAGGALALGLAATLAREGATVLVVAVELCSLTLRPEDTSRTNLVASVLFGDGAAAAVVRPEGPGPRIDRVGSHLIPATADVMGFDVGDHGLKIVLERELPAIVAEQLPLAIESFARACGREVDELGLHLVHPGGRRILEAYEHAFGLGEGGLVHSRAVLREVGNLSSASILAVLERALLARDAPAEGLDALLVAIGPGLSIEMSWLDWTGVAPAPTRSECIATTA